MDRAIDYIPLVIPTVAIACVFAFVTVVVWAESRRKERESLYRSELLKRVAESPGPAAEPVLALLREDEARKRRRVREGLTLAGMIVLASGACLIAILWVLPTCSLGIAVTVGLLPILVGLALLFHARFGMTDSLPG